MEEVAGLLWPRSQEMVERLVQDLCVDEFFTQMGWMKKPTEQDRLSIVDASSRQQTVLRGEPSFHELVTLISLFPAV